MPTYDYECKEHGQFEARNSMAERKTAPCPTCQSVSDQIIAGAPRPLIEAMADAGCPGAFMTSGDRMTARHRKAGQYHTTPSRDW